MSEPDVVTLTVSNHVATITLNRPERRNALNWAAYDALKSHVDNASRDDEIRCIIITGADPAFCSGDDVSEIMGAGDPSERSGRHQVRRGTTPAAKSILECEKPVIAAVNGAAVGWGMELALFCDIRIASDKARFGELFVKRGLVCDVGGFLCLPAIVGPSMAAEILFTGDLVDAQQAKEIGLVSRVVAHDELLSSAGALAARIAVNPPLALRYLKEGLRRQRYDRLEETGNWVSESLAKLFKTDDHKEGVASFLEKREPVFTGR